VEAITLRTSGALNPAQKSAVTPVGTTVTEALTDNYLKLQLKQNLQPNRWLAARVHNVQDGILYGEAVPTPA
jgi:hypothetical protein